MENSKKISLLKHEADINDDINDYVVKNKNIPNDLSKSLKEKVFVFRYSLDLIFIIGLLIH